MSPPAWSSSVPESLGPLGSITSLFGQITATESNPFGQISPTWRSSCRAAFAGKVRRIAAANEVRPMVRRQRTFKVSPLSCGRKPTHHTGCRLNAQRPSDNLPGFAHRRCRVVLATRHGILRVCQGGRNLATGTLHGTRTAAGRSPVASGGMLRRASGPCHYKKLSTRPIVLVAFGAPGLSRPLARTGCLLSLTCRVFALQEGAIFARKVTRIAAIPLTGKSLLVVFDAERAGIII